MTHPTLTPGSALLPSRAASPRSRAFTSVLLLRLLTSAAPLACSAAEQEPTLQSQESSLSATVAASVDTPLLHNYEDAPRSPDADDPAMWVNQNGSGEGLLIVTLKEAGLQVYDTRGKLLQSLLPPHRPAVSAADPPSPGGHDPGTTACPGSESGEEFSRFNNVDVHYGFALAGAGGTRKIDIAVVSDRGCDRLRIYAIDPRRNGGPLVEITAANVPRVFPERLEQPSPTQSPGAVRKRVPNPLEDQSTAYGLTVFQLDEDEPVEVIVSQRSRSSLARYALVDAGGGRVGYRAVRQYQFNPVFRVHARSGGSIQWSPCREAVDEDPQFEGLVVDEEGEVLYAAQEVVGIWRIPLDDDDDARSNVNAPSKWLIERTLSFGAPFWAVPNEDEELDCLAEAPADAPAGTVAAPGNPNVGGKHLAADVEGLALYDAGDDEGYLIASSQGDDTFHVYDRRRVRRHLGSFSVEGAGETDGHDVVSLSFGPGFPHGAIAVQNGAGAEPPSTAPINGFEYDHSSQFKIVPWEDVADALDLTIADPDDVLDD